MVKIRKVFDKKRLLCILNIILGWMGKYYRSDLW